MSKGDWHHSFVEDEAWAHPQTRDVKRLTGKTKHSLPRDHEGIFNCYCTLLADDGETEFNVTVGYSRFQDPQGWTHGWVQFGKNCSTTETRVQGLVFMLHLCGFEAPGQIYVNVSASGELQDAIRVQHTFRHTAIRGRLPPPPRRPPPRPEEEPASGGSKPCPPKAPVKLQGAQLPPGLVEQMAQVGTMGIVPTMLEPKPATTWAKRWWTPKQPAQAEQALASGSIQPQSQLVSQSPQAAQVAVKQEPMLASGSIGSTTAGLAPAQQEHGWHPQPPTAWPALPQQKHGWQSPPAAQVAAPMLATGSTQAEPPQQPQQQLEPEVVPKRWHLVKQEPEQEEEPHRALHEQPHVDVKQEVKAEEEEPEPATGGEEELATGGEVQPAQIPDQPSQRVKQEVKAEEEEKEPASGVEEEPANGGEVQPAQIPDQPSQRMRWEALEKEEEQQPDIGGVADDPPASGGVADD